MIKKWVRVKLLPKHKLFPQVFQIFCYNSIKFFLSNFCDSYELVKAQIIITNSLCVRKRTRHRNQRLTCCLCSYFPHILVILGNITHKPHHNGYGDWVILLVVVYNFSSLISYIFFNLISKPNNESFNWSIYDSQISII